MTRTNRIELLACAVMGILVVAIAVAIGHLDATATATAIVTSSPVVRIESCQDALDISEGIADFRAYMEQRFCQ